MITGPVMGLSALMYLSWCNSTVPSLCCICVTPTLLNSRTVFSNVPNAASTPAIVASAINETNEMSGSKSLVQTIKIKTETGDDNISPVIDTSRLISPGTG